MVTVAVAVALVVEKENNGNVVVVVLVEENNRILWPENLYKRATFYLFLSRHSALEDLT